MGGTYLELTNIFMLSPASIKSYQKYEEQNQMLKSNLKDVRSDSPGHLTKAQWPRLTLLPLCSRHENGTRQ